MPLSKEALRKIMLTKLREQKEESRGKKSVKIKEGLFRLKAFKEAKTVMFYLALKTEVQTQIMIKEALRLGKRIVVPVCDIRAKKISPCLITNLESRYLKRDSLGIEEPCCKKPVSTKYIDLCVVPGLAFDLRGNRLGRGKGYYDRFLSALPGKAFKVGLAFKFQVLNRLTQCLPHDTRVDKVLSA